MFAPIKKTEKIYPLCQTLNSSVFILERGAKSYTLKERPAASLRHEAGILAFLSKKAYPCIPRYYGTTVFSRKKLIIQEYIQGDELAYRKDKMAGHVADIARAFGLLHAIRRAKKVFVRDLFEKDNQSIELLFSNIRLSGRASGNLCPEPYLKQASFYQNDLNRLDGRLWKKDDEKIPLCLINKEAEIFLGPQEKVYLLDWEAAEYGDNAFDVADLLYIYPSFPLARFIPAYKKYADTSHHFLARIYGWFYHISLKELLYNISQFQTCLVYKKIPSKILAMVMESQLRGRLSQIEQARRRLQAFPR